MSLREDQRELTRAKILDTVLELVGEVEPDDLSVPEVARRSGVSVATIYRYFPTKAALIDAAAWLPAQRAQGSEPPPVWAADFRDHLEALWTSFAGNLNLLRRQVASAVGRDLRRSRLAPGRSRLAAELAHLGIPASSPEGARLVSLYLLLGGSLTLLELHDRQGLAVKEAVDEVAWAAEALLAATRTELAATASPARPRRRR